MTRAAALSDGWLAKPNSINTFYEMLRDRFEPGRTVWLAEPVRGWPRPSGSATIPMCHIY